MELCFLVRGPAERSRSANLQADTQTEGLASAFSIHLEFVPSLEVLRNSLFLPVTLSRLFFQVYNSDNIRWVQTPARPDKVYMFSIFCWIETQTCCKHWVWLIPWQTQQFLSGGAGSKTSASRVSWSSHSAELAESPMAADAGDLR